MALAAARNRQQRGGQAGAAENASRVGIDKWVIPAASLTEGRASAMPIMAKQYAARPKHIRFRLIGSAPLPPCAYEGRPAGLACVLSESQKPTPAKFKNHLPLSSLLRAGPPYSIPYVHSSGLDGDVCLTAVSCDSRPEPTINVASAEH